MTALTIATAYIPPRDQSIQAPDAADTMTRAQAMEALLINDPRTLTRWADAGLIAYTTTPGGHRRYTRASVYALLRKAGEQASANALQQKAQVLRQQAWAELREREAAGGAR